MNSSWHARLMRLRILAQGQFKRWNDRNIAALQTLANNLTPKNQKILGLFAADGGQALLPRQKRSGIKRPSLSSNVALFISAIFGKI